MRCGGEPHHESRCGGEPHHESRCGGEPRHESRCGGELRHESRCGGELRLDQVLAPGCALTEDRDWQRLDKWLWCARFLKARSDCARLVEGGLIRINRQPTDKPHARLRPGDVLTVPLARDVRVVRVLALAARRGPAPEARTLYEEIDGGAG